MFILKPLIDRFIINATGDIMKSFFKELSIVFLVMTLLLSIASCQLSSKQSTKATTTTTESATESTTTETTSEKSESETTEPTTQSVIFVVNTNKDDLRLRKEPSLDADVLVGIPKDTEVVVEEEYDGWSKVTYKGKIGWVKSDYLIASSETGNDESKALFPNDESSETSSRYYTPETTKSKTTTRKETTTKKTTTKVTKAPKPATVEIICNKDYSNVTVKIDPGSTYTADMAYKDVSRIHNTRNNRHITIKGSNIYNAEPAKTYYFHADFAEYSYE